MKFQLTYGCVGRPYALRGSFDRQNCSNHILWHSCLRDFFHFHSSHYNHFSSYVTYSLRTPHIDLTILVQVILLLVLFWVSITFSHGAGDGVQRTSQMAGIRSFRGPRPRSVQWPRASPQSRSSAELSTFSAQAEPSPEDLRRSTGEGHSSAGEGGTVGSSIGSRCGWPRSRASASSFEACEGGESTACGHPDYRVRGILVQGPRTHGRVEIRRPAIPANLCQES